MPLPPTASKALREQLDPLKGEIRSMAELANDQAHTWTPEDEAKWVKVNADYEALKARALKIEQAERVEAELSARRDDATPPGREDTKSERGRREDRQAQPTREDRANAFQGWMRHQSGLGLKKRHKEALQKCRLNPRSRELPIALPGDYSQVRSECGRAARSFAGRQARALAVNVNTAAGFTVPEGFVQNLEVALLQYSNIREYADVLRTATGQDLPWPESNDTANKGAILAENQTVGTQDLTFSQMILHAYKYTSKLVQVPVELMEDSAFDLAPWLGTMLGIRVARIQNDHMTTGTGAGQPAGVITASVSGLTAASSTAISADDLYQLEHKVDPAYRDAALGCGWMFHDNILGFLKRIKDGAGRYLWQAGLSAEVPDRIDGWPYMINQSMDSTIASGKNTVLFGAFNKYKVREVAGLRLRRLVERYADADQEGFVLFTRFDANLLDAGTHPLKYLTH